MRQPACLGKESMSQDVDFAFAAAVPTGRLKQCRTSLDFEACIAQLKASIAAENVWVLAELNPQMLLQKEGYAIKPARQIFYFHPRFMSRLLATNANAIVEAPLKLVVMEDAAEGVSVRYPDITQALAGYEGMQPLAEELASLTERIVSAVAA